MRASSAARAASASAVRSRAASSRASASSRARCAAVRALAQRFQYGFQVRQRSSHEARHAGSTLPHANALVHPGHQPHPGHPPTSTCGWIAGASEASSPNDPAANVPVSASNEASMPKVCGCGAHAVPPPTA